jgi:hypothetical protein
VDDDRQTDPTSRALGDFVRHVSGQVVVPTFTAGPAEVRHRTGHRRRRILAAATLAVAGIAAVALVVAYGPRSSPVGGNRAQGATPSPNSTRPIVRTTTTTTTEPSTTTTTTPSSTTPGGTKVVTYDPFTATGVNPALHVTTEATGTCFRYSRASYGPYFRCFGTSPATIYDPCFAGPSSTAAPLICPTNPTSNDVVEFTVTSLTSSEPATPTAFPWAFQLSSGQVCLFVSGAWGGLGPYACQSSSAAAPMADCHDPAVAAPAWTAPCQVTETMASPFSAEDVTTVWF